MLSTDTFKVEPGSRVAVLLFSYYATVRVKRVFTDTVYYMTHTGPCIDTETLFETRSGLIWTTHPCGKLLEFYGRGVPDLCKPATWSIVAAPKTWVRYVLAAGEARADDWAIGES